MKRGFQKLWCWYLSHLIFRGGESKLYVSHPIVVLDKIDLNLSFVKNVKYEFIRKFTFFILKFFYHCGLSLIQNIHLIKLLSCSICLSIFSALAKSLKYLIYKFYVHILIIWLYIQNFNITNSFIVILDLLVQNPKILKIRCQI